MKGGSFILDGVNSEDYNVFIQRTPLIETPARRVELKNAFGVHGGIPYDERAYNNTSLQLLMFIDGKDKIKDREKVDSLLRNTGVFKELIPYWDPDKIYYIMNSDSTQYESPSWYGEKQTLQANFTVKPYKYLRDAKDIVFTKSATAVNPFISDVAQPLITIEGTGDVTLKVNGVNYLIQNVTSSVTVDSERYSTYRRLSSGFIENQNSKYRQKNYPIFTPGSNSISVSGNVTKVTVKPRWRSLV